MTLIPKNSGLKDFYIKSSKKWVSVLQSTFPDKWLALDESNVYSLVNKDDVITYEEYLSQFTKH